MLRTDYKDDIIAESMGGRRRYQMISNSDGTVSFIDMTQYEQVGDTYGASEINASNTKLNAISDVLDTGEEIMANTEGGKVAGALGTKELISDINSSLSKYNPDTDMLDIYSNGVVIGSLPCNFQQLNLFKSGIGAMSGVTFYEFPETGGTISVSDECITATTGNASANRWFSIFRINKDLSEFISQGKKIYFDLLSNVAFSQSITNTFKIASYKIDATNSGEFGVRIESTVYPLANTRTIVSFNLDTVITNEYPCVALYYQMPSQATVKYFNIYIK